MSRSTPFIVLTAIIVSATASSARCQVATRPFASNVIVPQSHVARAPGVTGIHVAAVTAEVDISQRIAVTALSLDLVNPTASQQEAELLVPVPDDCVVRGFDFEGKSKETTAQLLPRGSARATYESLVARVRDPALLEFAARATVRTSVFPVPAASKMRVRLIYEHVLAADGDRIDYELPRSESLSAGVPWRVEARIQSARPIATVYSPSHEVTVERSAPNLVRLRLSATAALDPGSLQFSYLVEGDGLNGSFFAYPDVASDGGYFLLVGGVPVSRDPALERGRKREVIVVLDTSGSMAGPKIQQAKTAATQVLEGLADGEWFNIVDYAETVRRFESAPVVKSATTMAEAREYIAGLGSDGGTNIDAALGEALSEDHAADTLPIVLFLTDGLPTAGTKDESKIRERAIAANRHRRRIFTFGVGDDVNAPLLDHLASASRATSAYVRPADAVESAVSKVFSRLKGPILASPRIAAFDLEGKPADARVVDVMPVLLPDLYDGDELVLAGRYRGKEPLQLEIQGDYLGSERSFRFRLVPDSASLASTFVPRLWASRRIGNLVDELRQAGAASAASDPDPAEKELLTEVYRLSREFGVMTEYTAFLALEGTDLRADALNLDRLETGVRNRLQNVRSGRAAIAQSANTRAQSSQQRLNRRNRMVDATLAEVEITGVAQVGDRAFYKRGARWVDSKLPRASDATPPDETVSFGTPRHTQVVVGLIAKGRQGAIALKGDLLLELDGKRVLLLGPRPEPKAPAPPMPAPATAKPNDSPKSP